MINIVILEKKDMNATTHESQESGIIMWTYALRLTLFLTDDGISHDLAAVLHVWVRIVELLQSIRRQPEGFCKEGAEVVGELLNLSKICLERLSEAREKLLVWPLKMT